MTALTNLAVYVVVTAVMVFVVWSMNSNPPGGM